jgi:hypothetical protein
MVNSVVISIPPSRPIGHTFAEIDAYFTALQVYVNFIRPYIHAGDNDTDSEVSEAGNTSDDDDDISDLPDLVIEERQE